MTEIMNQAMKNHLRKSLVQNVREDGRELLQYRPVTVEYGVAKTAEGSARVKIGPTEVIAGVKLSIEKPFGDTPEDGVVMVGAELTAMSSPEFELGPPGPKAIEIARVADRGIREAHAVDTTKLCIEAGEKVWFIAVDVCSISDCGNLQEAVALATLAALQDAKFPKVGDNGKIDYKTKTKTSLPLVKLPIAISVVKIGDQFLVDPDEKEELVVDGCLTITVDEKGKITSLQKGGDNPLLPEDVDTMTSIAVEKAQELRSFLK
jgi:exosome complex component RRP42